MIRPLVIATLIAAPLAARAQEEAKDHLRFTNGDQLEGHFGGFNSSGKITWERADFAAPIELQPGKVRQIVLRDARPSIDSADPSHITLVNGDRIPGKIVAADEHEMTLESKSAGVLTLPREVVSSIAPNPFGGRLVYAGPFDDKGWKIIPAEKLPDGGVNGLGMGGLGNGGDGAAGKAPKKGDKPGEDRPGWSHAGAAWYSRASGDAVVFDAGMPDRAVLRFKLGWRSRPMISVAFHADLAQPAPKEPKKEGEDAPERPMAGMAPNFARMFGTGYVFNFNQGYMNLQRTGFDEDGNPEVERVRVGNLPRLPESGEALFEIRCDRKEGSIAVYLNGEFVQQWYTAEEGQEAKSDEPSYKAPGGGIGFQVQSGSSQMRVSDIVVAEWNGMTDSARSMENEQQDIVLLTNGTDRFSGRIHGIHEDLVEVEGKYATLKIPMQEVAEMHFARSSRRKLEPQENTEVIVHMKPVGRVSGVPVSSKDGHLQLDSRLAGKIDLDLSPAVVLEFQSAGGFLDEWDDDL